MQEGAFLFATSPATTGGTSKGGKLGGGSGEVESPAARDLLGWRDQFRWLGPTPSKFDATAAVDGYERFELLTLASLALLCS